MKIKIEILKEDLHPQFIPKSCPEFPTRVSFFIKNVGDV